MPGSERPFKLTAPLGLWRPLDIWVAGYALATLPLLLYGAWRGRPDCAAQAGVSLAVLAGSRLLALWSRDTRRILPTVLRLFGAPIIYLCFYRQVATLWPLFRSAPLDPLLVRAEFRIWGCQPSLAFRAALPSRALSELFCFAYLAYYFFTPVVGLTALARSYAAAERMVLAATGTFFLCYALFWMLPTVAPHFWFPPGAGPVLYDGYVFNHLLFFFTGSGEIRGGAWPSSHIAVALLYTLWARIELPTLFPYLAAVTALMLPAVVYLGAHYSVDVPAGLAAGLLAYAVSRALIRPAPRP